MNLSNSLYAQKGELKRNVGQSILAVSERYFDVTRSMALENFDEITKPRLRNIISYAIFTPLHPRAYTYLSELVWIFD